ncbi:hypothetical protein Aperf_G00000027954 [Anoplocephala perfoliata]
MFIKVCRSGKTSQNVSVPDDATVSTLKKAIEAREKIPYKEQTLTFNGLILEDDKLLSDYGIVEHCTVLLYLRIGFQPDFPLTVILPSKKKITLKMSGENTVADLRKSIEKKVLSKLASAELIYNHWQLEDERKLMEYEITGGAEIIVAQELEDEPNLELKGSTQGRRTHPIPLSHHQKMSAKFSDSSSSEEKKSDDDDSDDDDDGGGGDDADRDYDNNPDLITVIFLAKSGPPISLRLHPNTPIGKVRGRLGQIYHVPPDSLWFVRDGKPLNLSRTFAQYGISHGESVSLLSEDHVADTPWSENSSDEKDDEPKIRVIIQSKNGRPLACHVRPRATVRALKRGLEKETGVPQSRMRLFYQKKMLDDRAVLEDYDLTDGVALYLRLVH